MSTRIDQPRLSATRLVPISDAVDKQIKVIKHNLEAINGVASVAVSDRQNAPDCKAKPARITESPRGGGVAIAVFFNGCIVPIRVLLKDQKQVATMVGAIQRQWSKISSQSHDMPPAPAEEKLAAAIQNAVVSDREPNSHIENWLRLRPYVQRVSVTTHYGASLTARTDYVVQLSASKTSADVTIRIGRAVRCFRVEPKASHLSGISIEAKTERLVEVLYDDLRGNYPRLSGNGMSSEAAPKKMDLSQRLPSILVRRPQPMPADEKSHTDEADTKALPEQEVFVPSWVRPQKRDWYLFVASLGNGARTFTIERLIGRLSEFLVQGGMPPSKAIHHAGNFSSLLRNKNVITSTVKTGNGTSLFSVTLPSPHECKGEMVSLGQLTLKHVREPSPSPSTPKDESLKNGGTTGKEAAGPVAEPDSLDEGKAKRHSATDVLVLDDDITHVNGSATVEEVVYDSPLSQEGASESVDQHEPAQEANAQALPALFADNADSVITTLSLEQMQLLTLEELVGMLDRICAILRHRGYVPRLTLEGVLTLTYRTIEK